MGSFNLFSKPEGHWIKSSHIFAKDDYECSVCGRSFKSAPLECPRCGAKMRGTINDWEVRMRREALEEDLDEYEGIEDADY